MAGGVGSRFWPLSTTNNPKQFLDILGTGKSLLRSTFERLQRICPDENFYIVTNKIYKEKVLEQLPELKPEQVLLEPKRKNTAPCIAYANYEIRKRNPNARIIVAPSDHIILKEDMFVSIVEQGLDFVEQNNSLLTMGIKPSRPDTGYGYIQIDAKETVAGGAINKVNMFTEKPNLETAKFFVESGEFFWNSGIFIWSLQSIDAAFKEHLPAIYELFSDSQGVSSTELIDRAYTECQNISIDYGVMEKAKNVYVYKADFGWSDLGTWGSLYDNATKSEGANAIIGAESFMYESKNCVVNVPKGKLVVIQGLEDYIVVDSGESLLICKKSEEQKIKEYVNDIKMKLGENYV